MANATSTQLQELYVAYFGRAADPTGLDYWTEKGITTAKFAADMYVQAEFKDVYGSLSTESQVNQIYKNLFDRAADVAGLTYWTQQINLGNLKLAEIANDLIWAAQNNSGSSDDKTALTNRTNAAVAYTAKVKESVNGILAYQAESTSPWVSGDNITEAVSYMSGIDKDTASTTAGIATSVAKILSVGVPTVSSTFKLTSSLDNNTGGAGRDIFQGTNSSLQANDVLVGGDGIDTLEYVDSSTSGVAMPGVSLTDIEKISVRNISGSATAATAETALVTFKDIPAHESLTLASLTFTAGANGATAKQLATAFTLGVADTSNAGDAFGAVMSGTLSTDYSVASGGTATSTKFTAATAGVITDLEVSGTASTATNQTTVVTVTGNIGNVDNTLSVVVNGTTITSSKSSANLDGTKALVADLAARINTHVGTAVAHVDSTELVMVVNGASVSSFTNAGTTPGTTATMALADTKSTHVFAIIPGGTSADASAGYLNGELLGTVTPSANSLVGAGEQLAIAINNKAGRDIASFSTATLTIDGAGDGFHLSGVAVGTFVTQTAASVTKTVGSSASAAPTIDITQGVAAVDAVSQSVDASLWTGVDEYKNFASSNAVTFTGVPENDKLVVASVTSGSAATTDIQYASSVVKGDSTVGTLELSSSTDAGTITIGDSSGTGIETLNIIATGKNKVATIVSKGAKTVTLSADAATDVTISSDVASKGTLTVTGAGKVTLNTLDTAFDTVDASGNSGGIVVTDVGAVETVYTLGSGDDKFTTAAEGFATTDKFAVAAGTGTDTLVVASSTDLDASTEGARYTGFETLNVSATQDASLISGITSINQAASTSATLSGVSASLAEKITITGDQASAYTVTLANATGSSDVVTLDLKSGTSTTNVDVAGLSVIGVETLNLIGSTGTAGTDSDIDFAGSGADKLTAVNLSGTADMTFAAGNTAKAITLTSTSTGAITATGDFVKASTITTAGGKDAVTLSGNNGSTYNTGAGDDTITAAVARLVATGTDDHTVVAGAGTDTLAISDANPTVIDNHFTNVTGLEKMTTSTGATSITPGGNFRSAYADTFTLTSGTLVATSPFVYAGALYNNDTTITLDGSLITFEAASDDISITTGSGNDTVKTGTDATLVGVASTGSGLTISTGAGNDTIEYGHGQLLVQTATQMFDITPGKGVDSITKASGSLNSTIHNVTTSKFNFADGDSVVGAYDTITGYETAGTATGTHADNLNIGTGATAGTSIGSTDFGAFKSHTLSNGEVGFDDASTYAANVVINSGNLADATGYLNANLGVNTTVSFEYDSTNNGSVDSTFVFTNLAASASSGDTLILLKSTIGNGVYADVEVTGANNIVIS